ALKIGDASKVAPVDKGSLVLVALFAFVFLHERPSLREWTGILMVAGGVLVLALRREALRENSLRTPHVRPAGWRSGGGVPSGGVGPPRPARRPQGGGSGGRGRQPEGTPPPRG